MSSFDIEFLDHVAIRVRDLEASANWYEKVLGLTRYQVPEWGPYPIFMMTGKSGIALFPATMSDPEMDPASRNIKIDHFAFHVTRKNFDKAVGRYRELGIEAHVKDHHFFHSVYVKDPDGHTVELTTLVVPEDSFYK